MNLKIIYLCFVFTFFIGTCSVNLTAEEKKPIQSNGIIDKKIVSEEVNPITCYESAKYLVVAKDLKEKGGTDILVKYKSRADEKLSCSYVIENNDFEIKNEWVEYYAGLTGDFLLLDSTTGPGPSGLTIWNLKKRKKVYEGTWASPTEIRDDSIIFWLETGEATYEDCPERAEWESHGLGAAIETKVILSLSDFTVSKTKETRCSPRQ
ncbi:MAG: hypothetical protein ABIJ37_00860 [Pseudomonadota bacterium]